MIKGIPYFGENTQEIYESIQNSKEGEYTEKKYNSLYEFIISNINKKIIVVIDNQWLTWLNDIKFNYRDKVCYLPYFTYKKQEIEGAHFKNNNKGHLIINDEQLTLRYEYNYEKLIINIDNLRLQCIDIDNMEKFVVSIDKWINDTYIDLDKLYKLYVESCFREDDFIINKHMSGYHFISKSPREFANKERKLREQFGLDDYSEAFKNSSGDKNYRDVRQYKYEEVIQKYGLIDTVELYRERRLRFESYLYCVIRQGLLNGLMKDKHIYKVGNNIKLIIKDYWLDNIDKPIKTYIR